MANSQPPPKAKPLLIAARTLRSRATLGVMSRSQSGSAWRKLAVGGTMPSRIAITQAIISTGAFAVWVFALGGPFQHVPGQPVYGSLLLILYTLVVALIDPKEG